MSARVVLTPRPNSAPFQDKVLQLDIPAKIGRCSKDDQSSSVNGFFDSKVLSRPHALLLYQAGQFFILDTGSSNGTFVNNIRLSKAGQESEMTEIFTGDILRFGSDILDKSKNVTQKSVICKITLFHENGIEGQKRSSQSRLYRPSDSYEDIKAVTQNLQDSLSREKILEEKLNQIISLIRTIDEKSEGRSNPLAGFETEMTKILYEIKPQDNDRKKFETLRSEKALLRKKNTELEEELGRKEDFCSNLQKKAVEDAKNITALGKIIDKLRTDISNLENVVDSVKQKQEEIKQEYEEKLSREKDHREQEVELMRNRNKDIDMDRQRLEERVLYLMQFEQDQSRSSIASTPSTVRMLNAARSEMSTPSQTTNSIFLTNSGMDSISNRGEMDNYEDYLLGSSSPLSDPESDSIKFELQLAQQEMELLKDQNKNLREELDEIKGDFKEFKRSHAACKNLSQRNQKASTADDKERENLQQELIEQSSKVVELEIIINKMENEMAQLRGQAIKNWILAGEADFDSMFQDETGNQPSNLATTDKMDENKETALATRSELSKESSSWSKFSSNGLLNSFCIKCFATDERRNNFMIILVMLLLSVVLYGFF